MLLDDLDIYLKPVGTGAVICSTNYYKYRVNISSRLYRNSEADASELLENLEEIFGTDIAIYVIDSNPQLYTSVYIIKHFIQMCFNYSHIVNVRL